MAYLGAGSPEKVLLHSFPVNCLATLVKTNKQTNNKNQLIGKVRFMFGLLILFQWTICLCFYLYYSALVFEALWYVLRSKGPLLYLFVCLWHGMFVKPVGLLVGVSYTCRLTWRMWWFLPIVNLTIEKNMSIGMPMGDCLDYVNGSRQTHQDCGQGKESFGSA